MEDYTQRTISGSEDADAEAVRQLGQKIASGFAGLGYGVRDGQPDRRKNYLNLIYPFDNPKWAESAGKTQYSCALVAMTYMRKLGVRHPMLDIAYEKEIGMAISIVEIVGRAKGQDIEHYTVSEAKFKGINIAGWNPKELDTIDHGDIVVIGNNSVQTGGPAHAFMVTNRNGDVIDSVDGGQPDTEGYQILPRQRRLIWRGEELWAVSTDKPSLGRRVMRHIDVTKFTFDAAAEEP